MGFYPLMVNLSGKRAVLVGGGHVAYRKYRALRRAGALVTVVSPTLCGLFSQEVEAIDWIEARFEKERLEGAFLAVACTDSRETNALVGQLCREKGILACLCDDAEASDLIFPAVVDRGPLKIAVSTTGENPGVAKRIKEELEAAYPPESGEALKELGRERARLLKSAHPDREALRARSREGAKLLKTRKGEQR